MAEAVGIFGAYSSSTPRSFSLRPATTTTTYLRSHTPSVRFLPSHSLALPYLTLSNPHFYAAVVSSDSNTTSSDLSPPNLDNSDGGGSKNNGNGFGGGGGGGGGDDSNNDKGEEGSEGDKRKMVLSMSQKLTLGYAALVGVGGVMGYLKSGSQKSLLAGGLSAALLYFVYTELPARPVFASSVGLGISAALLGVMGSRFKKSGKVFPAGVVSLVSLIMTGGYLHGIMRSAH